MPPGIIAAALVGTATVASSVISAGAAGKAAGLQAAAAERSAELEQQRFETSRADMAPWLEAGQKALPQYAGILSGEIDPQMALEKYPGYQFALSQGREAIEKSAAGRGLLQSGQFTKDLTTYSQGVASSNFENYMNRLQGLAGIGQQAAVQTGAFGAQSASQQGAAGERAAGARGSGYLGQAEAIGGGLTGVAQIGGYLAGQGGQPRSTAPLSPVPDFSSQIVQPQWAGWYGA